MDVVVRGRHGEVSDRMRTYVTDKLAKLERYDSRPLRIDVEVVRQVSSRPDDSERVEITAHSRGPVVRVEASAEERHAAFDLAYTKLEAKLRKAADRRRVHYGMRRPTPIAEAPLADAPLDVSAAIAAAPAPDGETSAIEGDADEPRGSSTAGDNEEFPDGDGPMVVRVKTHSAAPMTLDQALYSMELVGHDFYLYVDSETGAPSVVYRRRAYDYGVIHLDVTASEERELEDDATAVGH